MFPIYSKQSINVNKKVVGFYVIEIYRLEIAEEKSSYSCFSKKGFVEIHIKQKMQGARCGRRAANLL